MTPQQANLIERLETRTKPVAFMPGLSEPDSDCAEAAAALRAAWEPSGEAEKIANDIAQAFFDDMGLRIEDSGELANEIALALTRYGQEQAAKALAAIRSATEKEHWPDDLEFVDDKYYQGFDAAMEIIRALEEQAT